MTFKRLEHASFPGSVGTCQFVCLRACVCVIKSNEIVSQTGYDSQSLNF